MPTITNQIRDKFRSVLMFDQNMLILAALLGFLAGFASTFFRWMIEFFESIFSVKGFSLAGIPPQTYPISTTIYANGRWFFHWIHLQVFPQRCKRKWST